ncbi:MAG: hemerythrin domain-containing protein [Candidatus Margulisbacteria bacterium]|nr:hemerythrin domain-containing protein [Candidatus Margulisiibacteriota bacterium]
MLPVGPMMTEHRLIEKMIAIIGEKLKKFEENKKVDTQFITIAVDFIRTYADKCHHGKEEDILFRELDKKEISAEHKKILEELKKEHIMGRKNVGKLVEANKRYAAGDKSAFEEIKENMSILVQFYPKHIEKEDKHFFLPVMDYFLDDEKDAMLNEGNEFDRKLIHTKYKEIVEGIE